MYLEDFLDEGLGGVWPNTNDNISNKAPYNQLINAKRKKTPVNDKKMQFGKTI